MLSNLLAIMAITIYNQMYGASAVLELITRYNKIATDVMQVGGFAAMVSTVKGLAVGITVLLYLIDLAGKVTEKNFSIEQFFKATLRFVVSYFFILYSDVITNYLIEAGTGITIDTVKDSGFAFFTDDPDNKTLLINGIKDMKAIETLGFVISSIIPWLFSMIGEVILQIVLISRILELVVMVTFAPLSISDIYREGTASPGVQYMKRDLALSLQVIVIILINAATQAIIFAIINKGSNVTIGQTITDILVEAEYSESKNVALANGSAKFTVDSVRTFMKTLTGQDSLVKVIGVLLARLGLIWNSMPLCEEITGAK